MPRYLGIDIGTTSVKAAVVRSAYRKLVLEGLAESRLAGTGEEAVKAAIKDAAQNALGAGAPDGVATSMPGTQTTLRTVRIPETAAQKLADVLPFELESQLPFDLENAVLDWRVLEGHTNEEGLAVLTAVAQVEDATRRIELVKGALGLEPERLGTGAFPIANLAPLASVFSEPRTLAVLDLGNKTSDLLFLEAGEPVFARTLSLGTEGLPQTAAKLAREVRLSLAAFRAQGGKPPDELYLCGGGAFVSGAESFLAAELERPVHRLPPLSVELGERVAPFAQSMPLYATALGLAMSLTTRERGIDLRKGPLAYERGWGWLRDRVPVLVGLGAAICVSFVFSSCTAMYAASKERATLESALGEVTMNVFGEQTTDADRAKELLAAESASEEDPLPHADAFDVMVRLSEHVPQSMTHDVEELDVQKGHVVIHGVVSTIAEAQSVATSLATEKCFSDVKNTRVSQMVGSDRQKYVIEFDLKCPEDVKSSKKKKKGDTSGSSSAASSAQSGGGK
jgi:general secretion pathway protein L